ncbi:hypothetical protein MANES_09G114000v8 [Manihot esculenta]|uniref:Uncharacterized protein n=1 Tax=Manihot esculenta TaxID=3983 RepID=A0A2C9VBL8_MANES|nr:hypothetical protein MANES_09G114000v8 [Manihot esculenta]
MEKQGTCISNSCTHSVHIFLVAVAWLKIFLLSFSDCELVLHVPIFPIMTTTPGYNIYHSKTTICFYPFGFLVKISSNSVKKAPFQINKPNQ